jgi:oxygen-dependent protoporphyrinogen oxidase
MVAKAKEKRKRGEKSNGMPVSNLLSYDEGMEVLIRRLCEDVEPLLETGVRVREVRPVGQGFDVVVERGRGAETIRSRRLVLAVPAFVAHMLLRDHAPQLAWRLTEIPYAGITVACLIYDRGQIRHSLDGFGFLVPRGQGPRMLGCLWVGSIFPDHVSDGRVLMRAMVGGARDPEGAILAEGRTVDLVHGELDRIMGGIEGAPREVQIYRHAKGIPQYVLGHLERMESIGRELASYPGLYLGGNAYRGVGVNDCVREADRLADRILAEPVPSSWVDEPGGTVS